MINLSGFTPIDIFLIWMSIFSISLLLVTIFALRRSNRMLKKLKHNEGSKNNDDDAQAQKDYQRIIETANEKARSILLEANQINKDSLTNFQSSYDELLANQKEVLEDSSNSLTLKYKDNIDTLNKNNIELLSNMYKDIEAYANSSFEAYKSVVEKQTFEAEKVAKDKINLKYAELDKELQLQKETSLKKLNEDIYKMLSNISKEVIGKSLDLEQHEELIIDALNKAKKEGLN